MRAVATCGTILSHLALLAFALTLLLPSAALAQVFISEIMFDVEGSDADREWIEVFNAGGSPVDLTEWKLFEGSTNHGLVAMGAETLAVGAYAVIADSPEQFRVDWPNFSGLLFDSSFSLSNGGETLVLRCCASELTDKDTATYTGERGAAGDGKTLQRQSVSGASFIAAAPTLGSGTLTSSTPTPSPSPESASPNPASPPASSESAGGGVSASLSTITLDAGTDRTAVAGADMTFKARAYNKKKEPLTSLLFRWNFGDGSTAMGSVVTHAFEYPGRYSVVLSVVEDEAASDQLVVTVDEMQLALSTLSGGAAIDNQSKREIDMSAWTVAYQGQRFTLPSNTILLAGQTLRLTPRTLGFTVGDGVELVYPNGVVALRSTVAPAPTLVLSAEPASPPVSTPAPPPRSVDEKNDVQRSKAETVEQVTTESEPAVEEATAPNAQVALAAETVGNGGGSHWWLGALGIALFGSGAVYVARRYKKGEWNIIEESTG